MTTITSDETSLIKLTPVYLEYLCDEINKNKKTQNNKNKNKNNETNNNNKPPQEDTDEYYFKTLASYLRRQLLFNQQQMHHRDATPASTTFQIFPFLVDLETKIHVVCGSQCPDEKKTTHPDTAETIFIYCRPNNAFKKTGFDVADWYHVSHCPVVSTRLLILLSLPYLFQLSVFSLPVSLGENRSRLQCIVSTLQDLNSNSDSAISIMTRKYILPLTRSISKQLVKIKYNGKIWGKPLSDNTMYFSVALNVLDLLTFQLLKIFDVFCDCSNGNGNGNGNFSNISYDTRQLVISDIIGYKECFSGLWKAVSVHNPNNELPENMTRLLLFLPFSPI